MGFNVDFCFYNSEKQIYLLRSIHLVTYNLYKFILLTYFAKALEIFLLYTYLLFLIGIVF